MLFSALFRERELKSRVIFIRDMEIIWPSGEKFIIPKGAKGTKIKEYPGLYETDVVIKLDDHIANKYGVVDVVKVKKDFKLIDNIS